MIDFFGAPIAELRARFAAAAADPAGPVMARLLAAARALGVATLGSPAVREAAAALLTSSDPDLAGVARFVLRRLAIAGVQQPPYCDYVAVPLLWDATAVAGLNTPDIARAAYRIVYDLVADLPSLPALENHERAPILRKKVELIVEQCREGAFTADSTPGLSAATVACSLLPESGVPDEQPFLRCVQSSEVIFAVSQALASRAAEHVAHAEAMAAVMALHQAARVERLLPPVLGLLASMRVESWLELRPLIVMPSAIQSAHFRELHARFAELRRIHDHPRYDPAERARLPWLREALDEAAEALELWRVAHLRVAAKFTPGASEGVTWLESQIERAAAEGSRVAGRGVTTLRKQRAATLGY